MVFDGGEKKSTEKWVVFIIRISAYFSNNMGAIDMKTPALQRFLAGLSVEC